MRPTSRSLGRRCMDSMAPTGSGKAITSWQAPIMASRMAGVRARRLTRGASNPAARALSRSTALAARIASRRSSSSPARAAERRPWPRPGHRRACASVLGPFGHPLHLRSDAHSAPPRRGASRKFLFIPGGSRRSQCLAPNGLANAGDFCTTTPPLCLSDALFSSQTRSCLEAPTCPKYPRRLPARIAWPTSPCCCACPSILEAVRRRDCRYFGGDRRLCPGRRLSEKPERKGRTGP